MSTEVVDRQVDAYNRHDLDSFAACYSENVVIRSGHGLTLMAGVDALRQQYDGLFTSYPDLRAEVRQRIVRGEWVIDEEEVKAGDATMGGVVAYHVVEGLIDAVVMLTDGPAPATA